MAGIAGCLANSPFSEETEGIPNEIEAVLDRKWQAQKKNEPETYQDLYHSESPIRDRRYWDSDRWHEMFQASSDTFEYTIETRELLEEAETEATVREVIYRKDNQTGSHRGGSTDRITYDLRVENGDWRIFDEEREKYYPWMGNGDEYAPEDFEPCNREVIRISSLPEFVHNEVQTALEEGLYEAEELYINHLMDVETSYLEHSERDTFYRAHVTEMSDGYRLELEEVTPLRPDYGISLSNKTDTEQTVTVRVERDTADLDVDVPEAVFEETYTVPPNESVETEQFDRYFVDHRAEIETDDASETFEWTERELAFPMRSVTFTDEGIRPGPEPHLEPVNCTGVWANAIASD